MPTILTSTVSEKTLNEISYTVITLVGQIDESNLADFEKVVNPTIEISQEFLIFDLEQLEFINSKVIGFLAATHSRLADLNKKMLFIKANQQILDIIELVGLTQIVPTFELEEEALAAIKAGEIS
jgi:anti-anti-sigma factor